MSQGKIPTTGGDGCVDLVIGAVFGYDFEQLEAFVTSLRQTNFTGDIVFLYGALSSSTRERLTRLGVKLVDMKFHPRANRFGKMWLWLAPAFRKYRRHSIVRRIFKEILPLATVRFFRYREFLSLHSARYRNVLLTDVRDVVFQEDPLRDFEKGVEVFEESKRVPLKLQYQNADWIINLYGKKTLDLIGDWPVLCSGTIMGDVASLLDFLTQYEEQLFNVHSIEIPGSDQGVHNYLCRSVIPQDVRVVENGMGRVLTMGTSTAEEKEFELTAAGEVLGADGKAAAVVHQYNRHPIVTEQLQARFATQAGS